MQRVTLFITTEGKITEINKTHKKGKCKGKEME